MAHVPQPPVVLSTAMPTPGSLNAPYFKGERVTDFLDALEAHGNAAGIPNNDLPSYVLRYVHRRVRQIVESAGYWTQRDWAATRVYLTDMYSSSDQKLRITPDRFRKWVKLHAENRIFIKLQDVDRYYREFTAQSTPLTTAQRITANEANLLFYRGIPPAMRKKIRRKIPAAQQTSITAPTIANVLGYLRAHFNEDDIDNDDDDVELSLDSDGDSDGSNSEDEDFRAKAPRKRKKRVRLDTKEVPGAPPVQPPIPTDINTLTKQMEDLRLGHARQLEDIQRGQAMLLRELSAVKVMNVHGRQHHGNYNSGGPSMQPPQERTARCFICDQIHRLGVHYCPDVPYLINEGLAKFTTSGRLMRPDDSDLPRAPVTGGGVAKALREERRAAESLKGKAKGGKRLTSSHGTLCESPDRRRRFLCLRCFCHFLVTPHCISCNTFTRKRLSFRPYKR